MLKILSYDCAAQNLGVCYISCSINRGELSILIRNIINSEKNREKNNRQFWKDVKILNDALNNIIKIEYENVYDLIPGEGVGSVSNIYVAAQLKGVLDHIATLCVSPDVVLIEQQIKQNKISPLIANQIAFYYAANCSKLVFSENKKKLHYEKPKGFITYGINNMNNMNNANNVNNAIDVSNVNNAIDVNNVNNAIDVSNVNNAIDANNVNNAIDMSNVNNTNNANNVNNANSSISRDVRPPSVASGLVCKLYKMAAKKNKKKFPEYVINNLQGGPYIELVGSSLKNSVDIDRNTSYSYFISKYSNYYANKLHASYHYLYFSKLKENIIITPEIFTKIKKEYNKLDDIADAFTMAYAWIVRNSIISFL